MTDKYYYNSLNSIDAYVYRWSRNDSTLKYQTDYLQEDARSFCYLYYLQVVNKFNDEKQINNYYYRTVLLKLDGYLSSYYKNQRFTTRKGKSVRAVKYTFIHADAPVCIGPDDEICSLWEMPGRHTGLTVAFDEPDEYDRDVILEAICKLFLDTAIQRSKKHKNLEARDKKFLKAVADSISASDRRNYDMHSIAESLNIAYNTAVQIWKMARNNFREFNPELANYVLHNDEAALTDEALKKLKPYLT